LSTRTWSGFKSPWLKSYRKRGQARGQEIVETIKEEEEENEQEESGIREWTEGDNEIGNICDPYKES